MQKLFSGLARFCLAAWSGAGTLFVSVAIRPIRSPQFDSSQKGLLTQILFPGYYQLAFLLLGVAFACGLLTIRRHRQWIPTLFAGCALILMTVDWFYIYSPLAEMIDHQIQNHAAPPSSFRTYHIASMVINAISLSCATLGAIWACFSNGNGRESSVDVLPVE